MPNSQAVKAMVFDTVIVGSNPTWAAIRDYRAEV